MRVKKKDENNWLYYSYKDLVKSCVEKKTHIVQNFKYNFFCFQYELESKVRLDFPILTWIFRYICEVRDIVLVKFFYIIINI